MKTTGKITADSLMTLEAYAKWRKLHHAELITHRKLRNVHLGEHITVQFESEFAGYVGAKFGVGLTSCTAALHLGLLALGVGPGDDVVTSPITFSSTVNVGIIRRSSGM